jgi:lysozyme
VPDSQALGIDVSGYQTTVDWQKLTAAGLSFAFIKATEGSALVDHRFAEHWAEAKNAGVLRGAYHFFRPQLDAALQAQVFLAQLQDRGELPPVLDVELANGVAPAQIISGVKAWLELVSASLGRPLIYTMPGFWDTLPYDPWFAANADLWVAHWGVQTPTLVNGFASWRFWQFTNKASFNGTAGTFAADENRFNGTLDELRAYSAAFTSGQRPPQSVQFNLHTTLGIQQALNYLKVPTPPLAEDGLMGPLTRSAIQLFQGRNALAVDGTAGPSTRAALQTILLRMAQQAA